MSNVIDFQINLILYSDFFSVYFLFLDAVLLAYIDRIIFHSNTAPVNDLFLRSLLCLLNDLLFLHLVGVLLGQRFRSLNWLTEQESGTSGRFLQFMEHWCDQTVALATNGTDLEPIKVVQGDAL